jgi:hypothetical protein
MATGVTKDIGRLEARMDSTERRLEQIEKKIDVLVDVVAQSKGSLKTLIAVSSFVAAATAGITTFVSWLIGRH